MSASSKSVNKLNFFLAKHLPIYVDFGTYHRLFRKEKYQSVVLVINKINGNCRIEFARYDNMYLQSRLWNTLHLGVES